GGLVIVDRLRPCRRLPETESLVSRRSALDRFMEQGPPRKGYMLGDLTCGSRPATLEETVVLAGAQANGVPRGLARCNDCGEWRGRCPDARVVDHVIDVHCRCANDNRCAACGKLLHTRKLNANEYNEVGRRILHTPGFCGLSHVCATATGPTSQSARPS